MGASGQGRRAGGTDSAPHRGQARANPSPRFASAGCCNAASCLCPNPRTRTESVPIWTFLTFLWTERTWPSLKRWTLPATIPSIRIIFPRNNLPGKTSSYPFLFLADSTRRCRASNLARNALSRSFSFSAMTFFSDSRSSPYRNGSIPASFSGPSWW